VSVNICFHFFYFFSDDDVDCSSVTSAEIDIAISADEDYTALTPTPTYSPGVASSASSGESSLGGATASSRKHVAFSSLPFERGSVARATLPAFTSSGDSNQLSADTTAAMFQRPTTPGEQLPISSRKQRLAGEPSRFLPLPSANQRPRSKSVGRTINVGKIDSTTSGAVPVVSTPLATSTSSGRSTVSLASTMSSNENTDVTRGERLNYCQKNNSLLKIGNMAASSVSVTGQSNAIVTSACHSPSDYVNISIDSPVSSRLSRATGVPTTSGRRSVDSVTQKTWDWAPSITSSSTTIRDGGQEDLIEGEMIGSGMSRCRGNYFQRRAGNLVTTTSGSPYSSSCGDPAVSLVAGPRTRIQSSSGRSAMSDIEVVDGYSTPSRLSGPYSSGRSLPRNGLSWTSGEPVTSLLADHLASGVRMTQGALLSSSSCRPSYGGTSAGGGLYAGCNGLTSHLSASNENLRKYFGTSCLGNCLGNCCDVVIV